MRFHPVTARLVNPELAARVVTPAYDLLDVAARKRILAEEPLSFLHAMRSPDEYEPGVDIDAVLADSARGLRRLLAAGAFDDPVGPAYFVYRLETPDHVQSGVVGILDVADAVEGRVRPHETTRVEKEDRMARHLSVVKATSSPVALTHRPDRRISGLISAVVERRPALDMTATEEGLRQRVWKVEGPGEVAALREAFAGVPIAYVTDGHHRIAAATRLARVDPGRGRFLAVFFPAGELRIIAFHRVLRDLGDHTPAAVEEGLRRRFRVEEAPTPDAALPRRHGELGILLPGRRLRIVDLVPPGAAPLDAWDVVALQHRVLEPVFGVADPRTDPRLDYVPGVEPVERIAARVEAGAIHAAFLVHPMTVEDMMAASDRGLTLPPKSTWFAPKPRSGVFLMEL